MTLGDGTTVYYGGGYSPPFEKVGTVIGWAKYDGQFHYAIRSASGSIFTRSESMVSDKPPEPETTLPEYVAAYIKHELDLYTIRPPATRYVILLENLDTWIANAFEAYEGGAR